MDVLGSVICAVDFSDGSREALRWALALARLERTELLVLYVVDPLLAQAALTGYSTNLVKEEAEPELQAFIAATVGEMRSAPDIRPRVVVGQVAERILELAEQQNADLIVMGTQGLGGVQKLILGSTTERVLRRTRTAVLAIPPADSTRVTFDAGGPRFRLSNVTAALDFSESSVAAARLGARFASLLEIPLRLVHVVAPVHVIARWRAVVESQEQERVAAAAKQLAEAASDLEQSSSPELVVLRGSPAEQIASLASGGSGSLITMGLSSGRPLGRRPGSIAYRVLSQGHMPVLVVPPETDS